MAAGRTYNSCLAIRKACEFLLSKELPGGGWGESYLSCQNKVYTNLEGNKPHLVNTAWVLMALIEAGQVKSIIIQLLVPRRIIDFFLGSIQSTRKYDS